jgi:hypothetical protein
LRIQQLGLKAIQTDIVADLVRYLDSQGLRQGAGNGL